MKAIFRYPLKWTDDQTIELPEGANKLDTIIKVVDGIPNIYTLVDPDSQGTQKMRIIMIGTGVALDEKVWEEMQYLDTITKETHNGAEPYVFHVFTEL